MRIDTSIVPHNRRLPVGVRFERLGPQGLCYIGGSGAYIDEDYGTGVLKRTRLNKQESKGLYLVDQPFEDGIDGCYWHLQLPGELRENWSPAREGALVSRKQHVVNRKIQPSV